ncbi:amidohydrolase family protein [Limnohabitans sp.]|uniref:amidohydrolase family protein n=1 Tax=Limnohabitans sp. TaxID=1907725 RepID=UPI002AFF7114|nr:amidohydrolase family protein [Limnohabitans sp.]
MIDAHFHCWQLARADYGWLTSDLAPIYRDVAVADWQQQALAWGVNGGVLVQAAPTAQETTFLLQQAHDNPCVLGVVGWIDMLAPDAVDQVAQCAAQPMLKGLRPMLQDLSDPDWILQPAIQPVLSAMAQSGLVFDALIKPVHIPRILKLTQAHPDLTVVVDHGAKPVIDALAMDAWAQSITQLARETHPDRVVCKMSGLWTEAPKGQPVEAVRPWCEALLAIWGPQRLLWGSDWPVLELSGTYGAWRKLTLEVLSKLSAHEKNAVLGDNARRTYRL